MLDLAWFVQHRILKAAFNKEKALKGFFSGHCETSLLIDNSS